MREQHCDHCDLIIGQGCACRTPATQSAEPTPWTRLPGTAILISPGRIAHTPGGCTHMTESDVLRPGSHWGWITDPPPGLWTRISDTHPATATGGRLGTTADRRCRHCAESLR